MAGEGDKKAYNKSGILPPLDSLKCSLTGEYLVAPVTLPCLHSFSKNALEKYNQKFIQKANPVTNGYESDEEAKKDSGQQNVAVFTVQCPTCIEVLGISPTTHPQVPFDNLRLSRIIDMVRESRVLCENCKEAQSEVYNKTLDCWLCAACFQETHSAPIFKSCDIERLTHSEMFALPKCETHPKNDLEFFSTEDEVGVCQACLLKGDFVGKPYCLVNDVRKMRQAEIEKSVRVIMREKERLITGRQAMENVQDLLVKNLEDQQEEVKQNFAAIREALDKREAQTLEALTKLKDVKHEVIDNQVKEVNQVMSVINDGVKNVKLVLNHSNDLELVYLTIVLQEFVADLKRFDTMKFSNEDTKPLSYFYDAAVDPELPVVLSDKIADLVSVYASVPEIKFEPESSDPSTPNSPQKARLHTPVMSKAHKAILKDINVEDKADEYGCAIF